MVLWPRCHRWAWVASAWRYWGGRSVIGQPWRLSGVFGGMSGVFLIQTPLLKAAWHKGFDISGVSDVLFWPWSG